MILQALLIPIADRAVILVPILLLAFILGEPLGKLLRFPALRRSIAGRITRLGTKLNRPTRSIATRLYRGIVTLLMLLIPALIVGLVFMRHQPPLDLVGVVLLIPFFGNGLAPYSAIAQWRRAKAGTLSLQADDPTYLYPDQHGLLRASILQLAERYAILLVGGGLYFAVAGMAGFLSYLMLAAAAAIYAPLNPANRAFGWAATSLFALVDAVPRLLACILLWFAALATPGTHPFSALKHLMAPFHGWLASLLNLSLGGPMKRPSGPATMPWLGKGSPQPTARDLGRTLQLLAVASLLWLMLLGSSIYLLPFIK